MSSITDQVDLHIVDGLVMEEVSFQTVDGLGPKKKVKYRNVHMSPTIFYSGVGASGGGSELFLNFVSC
jgi:hypothetical protein